jgi:cell wall assembly regulator SMI1
MLRVLRKENGAALEASGGHVWGYASIFSSQNMPFQRPGNDALQQVGAALAEADMSGVNFKAEISAHGHATLRLYIPPPVTCAGFDPYPGTLLRYEGALPEPSRHLPDPNPGATPHPSADPALLERVLRERLPDVPGATEEELAAAEARLGIPLPDELKALYRTMREPMGLPEDDWDDGEDGTGEDVLTDALLGEMLLSVDDVFIGYGATLRPTWNLAEDAVITPPVAAVQQLVGSPGWVVFGLASDFAYAIDMTPGPRGHLGQVIAIPGDEDIGASLKAHSLTDFVQGRFAEDPLRRDEAPVIAKLHQSDQRGIEASAHPDLEVLVIYSGQPEGEPVSLASLEGLPALRTLSAPQGTLADPLEIAELASLEYLALGPQDWRTLLDAKAVPGSLLAAKIIDRRINMPPPRPDPAVYIALANEIFDLWGGQQIAELVIEGQLE